MVGTDKSKLSDSEWGNLLISLKKTAGIRIGCEATCRQFVEAVLWVLRAGAQWRCLPRSFGYWNRIFKRFARWSRVEVWEKILQSHAGQPDLERVCIDSTVIRAQLLLVPFMKAAISLAAAFGFC
ncbi:transposase [Polaromonas sp. P1-6]|nr:transposase [Polaromonas sp. P1-6]